MKKKSTSEMMKLSLDFETVEARDCLVTELLILTPTEVMAKAALYYCILLQDSFEK